MKTKFYSFIYFGLFLSLFLSCHRTNNAFALPFFPKREYRALNVDAFYPGFKTKDEVSRMVDDVRRARFNAIYFQARKACDAYYESAIEPKAMDIAPDFDPLAEVIKLCHDTSGGKQYIQVHAWIVSYRCMVEDMKIPEGEPRHITLTHPEWISCDYNGNDTFDKRQYLDPGIPEVLDYNVRVVADIVKRYDVDGIRFDYMRYAEAGVKDKSGNAWGYNPIALARFERLYKKSGKPAPDDPQWNEFRHRQVYDLLRKVYVSTKEIKPHVRISSSLTSWGRLPDKFEKSDPYVRTIQNWPLWMKDGLLDMGTIMNYRRYYKEEARKDFADWTGFMIDSKKGRHAVIGIGAYLNTIEDTLRQIEYVRKQKGADGVFLFSYHRTNREGKPREEYLEKLRNGPFKKRAEIPKAGWLATPKTGIIKGTVTSEGKPVDGIAVKTDRGQQTHTDGTGFFALTNLKPGNYNLVIHTEDNKAFSEKTTILKGDIKEVNFNLE